MYVKALNSLCVIRQESKIVKKIFCFGASKMAKLNVNEVIRFLNTFENYPVLWNVK